jgi:hypothetical protein
MTLQRLCSLAPQCLQLFSSDACPSQVLAWLRLAGAAMPAHIAGDSFNASLPHRRCHAASSSCSTACSSHGAGCAPRCVRPTRACVDAIACCNCARVHASMTTCALHAADRGMQLEPARVPLEPLHSAPAAGDELQASCHLPEEALLPEAQPEMVAGAPAAGL